MTQQPFTMEFPRANIHELLSPDLLHQVVKGTFKDHIVTWVHEYLLMVHRETQANEIIDDIDRRCVSGIIVMIPYTPNKSSPISQDLLSPIFPGPP
jgi:hypothetical protein